MSEEKRIKNKIIVLYELFEVYEEDVTPEELSRLYSYYHKKEKMLDQDIKKAKQNNKLKSNKD